jgi:hypothetical protein
VYRHADTHKLALVRCRGVRRMHLNSNMSACEQASVSQFGSSAHGSLLRAKFQFVTFGSRDQSDVREEDSYKKERKGKK